MAPKDAEIFQFHLEASLSMYEDQIAIEHLNQKLTYGELDQRATQFCQSLLAKETETTRAFVGVLLNNRTELIGAMIGIMKAAKVFVPLDHSLPAQRIMQMMQTLELHFLITTHKDLEAFFATGGSLPEDIQLIFADDDLTSEHSARELTVNHHEDDPLYVYFTSGSTGTPKAIVGKNKSLLHFINWEVETFGMLPGARFSQFTTSGFDAFLRDVFAPLFSGGTICIPNDPNTMMDAGALIDWIDLNRISYIHCVPTLFRLINSTLATSDMFSHLKYIFMSGERIYPQELSSWFETFGERIQLVNFYGATETTMIKMYYLIRASDVNRESIPIGRAMRGAKVLVLDEKLAPCEPLVPGEIYIMTPYKSHGYYGMPELNAATFVPNPYKDDPEYALYKTGDKGRMLSDGNLEFLGRIDRQIKLRGVRIEPAEIEQSLQQQQGVKQVAVVNLEKGTQEMLAACVVLNEGATLDSAELENFAREKLPQYMVPGKFVILEQFPQKTNGKIDYQALVECIQESEKAHSFLSAQTPLQEELVDIWKSVIGHGNFGITNGFFELGANSFHLIGLISKLFETYQIRLSIEDIFTYATIEKLAKRVEELLPPPTQAPSEASLDEASMVIPVYDRQQIAKIPLSYAQEQLWFIDQFDGSVHYHIPFLFQMTGELNVAAFEESWLQILNRHEGIRSMILSENGEAWQTVVSEKGWQANYLSVEGWEDTAIQQWIHQEVQRPFQLDQDYKLRVHVLTQSANQHQLLLVLHHITFDGWSMMRLMDEFAELYRSKTEQYTPNLPSLSIQYADYAIWQRANLTGELLEEKLAWWTQHLAEVQPLDLPLDYPRPTRQSTKGQTIRATFDRDLVARLKKLSQEQDASLYMTLLTMFKVLLYRYTAQENICVGTPIANRTNPQLEPLLGFFANTLALNTRMGGEPNFEDLVSQVKQTMSEALAHQEVPFEQLVERLVKERDISRSPLFQVVFIFQNMPKANHRNLGNDLVIQSVDLEHGKSKLDLTFTLDETERGLEIEVEYCVDLFQQDRVERMIQHYEQLLRAVVRNPLQPISTLNLLPETEKHKLLVDFNDTDRVFEESLTFLDRFEEQVALHPDGPALKFEDGMLTYQELDAQSNQLGHYLKKQGVCADTLVGIWMNRHLDLIVTILGVLKAGGAYVPIDPEYPTERVNYMLKDTSVELVLTDFAEVDHPALEQGIQLFHIYDQAKTLAAQPTSKPTRNTQVEDLAYVIYTSGSTGVPKGVMVEHGSLANLLEGMNECLQPVKGFHFISVATFSFDMFIMDLYWPLFSGGCLILAGQESARDAHALRELIQVHKPDYLQATPTTWEMLLSSGWKEGKGLTVLIGGEALKPAVKKGLLDVKVDKIWNLYGPTEATVWATLTEIKPDEKISIGRPIPNVQIHILTPQKELCPIGVVGDLYISGYGLARGYLNKVQLHHERFVPNPFSSGELMYQTGDKARWLADGNIEFFGRSDRQVKVRGHRIELGEIENVLSQSPAVKQCAVVVKEDSTATNALFAYVVSHGTLDKTDLQGFLRQKLPVYMVPTFWIQLEEMPLTASGKIDKRRLQLSQHANQSLASFTAARNETEKKLASIWGELLGVEQVGIHDNFFDLGGHSLLATRVISTIQQAFDTSIAVKTLFEFPTIAELSEYLELTHVQEEQEATEYELIDL